MFCLWNELSFLSISVPLSSFNNTGMICSLSDLPHSHAEDSLPLDWILGSAFPSFPSLLRKHAPRNISWVRWALFLKVLEEVEICGQGSSSQQKGAFSVSGWLLFLETLSGSCSGFTLCSCCGERTAGEPGLWIWVPIFSETFTCCFALFYLWSSGSSSSWDLEWERRRERGHRECLCWGLMFHHDHNLKQLLNTNKRLTND